MKLFSPKDISKNLIPLENLDLFDRGYGLTLPEKNSETAQKIIMNAEKHLAYQMQVLPLSQYIRFTDDGNRTGYETPYFERRNILNNLIVAELCEDAGRFIPKIMDILFAICEESTWVIPAHNYSVKVHSESVIAQMPEPVGDNIWAIDLFSAATGAAVAVALYLFRDKFEKAIPSLFCDRLRYELSRRIVKPYLNTYDLWWMGYNSPSVNNWNPWINCNVFTVATLGTDDEHTRRALAEKCAESINYYVKSLPSDGGCDEGPGYWGASGGCLLSFTELCSIATGGKCNCFDENPLLQKVANYMRKANISGEYFFNCADAHPRLVFNSALIRRAAKKFGDDRLYAFANGHINSQRTRLFNTGFVYVCPIANLIIVTNLEVDDEAPEYRASHCEELEALQIAAFRENTDTASGFYLGMKGGHNAENHNHLDVGNYIVYCDGQPLVIDPGVGTYTRFTFSLEHRYNMFAFRTEDHNLPLINGKGQWIEHEHHADDFCVDKENNTISVQLKEAYSNKDEIESFVRTASLCGSKVSISDRIKLKEPGCAEFFITVYNKPTRLEKGTYRIAENAVISFSDGFDITVEAIPFEEESFIKDWGVNEIYKFRIKSAPALCEINLNAEIKHM